MKKCLITVSALCLLVCVSSPAVAGTIVGGDASSQASADVLLDIAFVIDTSASMDDEIANITANVKNTIETLSCPDCNVWVRADFYGIDGTYGTLFNQSVDNITGNSTQTVTNQLEDNAPAVSDMITYYNLWGSNDAISGQDYYKAIVTIGDEGTEDGHPVAQDDWNAAYAANQAAIANDFMIFSLVGTVVPSYAWDETNRNNVFSAMAIGGTGGGYTFGNTGGTFALTTTSTLQQDIKDIICTAAGGGTPAVPEPSTILLFGAGLAGLAAFGRRKN